MHRITCFLIVLVLGLGFAACNQPNTTESENFMDQPMKAAPPNTIAKPAIVYTDAATGTVLHVMDSSGTNQTVVYTGSAGVSTPNWSPGNSIVFVESGSIKTAEITVNSSGVAVSSNMQTIASVSSTTHILTKAVWSSTTTVNAIAFPIQAKSNTGANNYLCIMSASGTIWDTLYTTPYDQYAGGLTWSPDDAKLAVLMESRSTGDNWFVILNTSTGAITDSIPVNLEITSNNFRNNVEWSRASGTINKLAFVSHEMVGPRICYLTPTSGSTPTTNNVSLPIAGTLTWSPNNSSLMYVHAEWSNKCRCEVFSLSKNRTQSTTTSSVDNSFSAGSMNWHR
jgi:hypothetical protein